MGVQMLLFVFISGMHALPSAAPTSSLLTMSPTVAPTRTTYTSVDGRIGCSFHETTAPIVTVDRCNEAAEYLGLADTEATVNNGRSRERRPFGCYFDEARGTLQLNLDGSQERVSEESNRDLE